MGFTLAVSNYASFKPTDSSIRVSRIFRHEIQPFDCWYLLPFAHSGEDRELSEEILEDEPGIHGRIDLDGTVITGVNVIHFRIELRGGSPF
jgi:hypothetical protein